MNVRNDIKGAFEAAKRHSLGTDTPSSTSAFPVSGSDPASGAATAFPVGPTSAFGGQSSGPTSAFGQQQGTSAFGTSAFGAPAFGQSPTFGQPSNTKSAFGGGAASSGGFSAFAGPGPSAFATAATNPTTSPGSVFGQSAFSGSGGGAQPGGQSAFGTTDPTSTNSAFARPSAFGSTSGSGFGQTSPFGATNNAPSAFGQPPPTSTSAFAQTTAATSTSPTASPFGQAASNSPTFGQPTSVFGQPIAASAFNQKPTTSAFGQSNSAFGATAPAQQSVFGQAMSPVSQGGPAGASKPHAQSTAPDFANAKSTYRPGLDPYDTLLPADYSSLLPDNVRAAFAASQFSWDNVPDWIPPLDMR